MRIGIVCYPSVGGSGIVATNLGLELAKRGHSVHFISYESPFRLVKKYQRVYFHKVNINKYDLFKYPDYTLPLAVTIGNVHEKYELDILHVHYAVPHATAALLALQMIEQCSHCKPPKVITTLHGTDITLLAQDKNLFEAIKFSVERSHGVTAVSKSLRDETIKILKTKKAIEVIYNFYTPLPVTKSPAAIRKSLRIADDAQVAIHLSNLRPVKRIPDLLKIAAGIKDPRFKLLILAGGDFSPYQALAKKLKLGKKLIVKKNIQDVGNYINTADVGIYTSDHESFGMAMLETMAYGKPVLATKAGGVPEVVSDGKEGFLLKVGDVKGFVKKLNGLLENHQMMNNMGQAAKKTAREKFCSDVVVSKYIKYYESILK